MKQTVIFEPFFIVMLLTKTVWFYMYSRRIPLIQRSSDFLASILAGALRPARCAPAQTPDLCYSFGTHHSMEAGAVTVLTVPPVPHQGIDCVQVYPWLQALPRVQV
jgi:hypothetical protein